MGFTNFLGRKPAQNQDDVSSFKAQAYGSTVESLPPVLGTNPIPGNGVNAIGSNGIHQLPRKKSKPQLPLSASHRSFRSGSASPAVSVTSAAPAPLVPRLRSSSTHRRPDTAPDDPADPAFQSRPKSSGKTRSRRDSFRQSVAFLRKTGSHGDFHAESRSRDSSRPPPVPAIPAAHSPAPFGTSKFPRSDTASLTLSTTLSLSDSLNRGPGFVDILDAQGEFRPSNFRSRLEATGARDYGEDVAERNMELNGVGLSSPTVSAYYATSSHPAVHSSRPDGLDLRAQQPRTVNFPKRVDSYDQSFALQTVSTQASRQSLGSHEKGFQNPQRRAERSPSSKPRPQALRLQPIISHSSSDSGAEAPQIPRSRDRSTSQMGQRAGSALPSPRQARDGVPIARQSPKSPLMADFVSTTFQLTSRPHTRDSGSHAKDWASKGSGSRYGKRRSGLGELTVDSMADINFASAAPAPGIPSFRFADHSAAHMFNFDQARSQSAHARTHSGRMRANSRPSSSSSAPGFAYPRTQSLGGLSLPPRPYQVDITEHIPPRSSSRRNWSISSSTAPPTASDWSSDLFQRPHSRHTAETSIPPSGSVKSLSLGTLKDALCIPQAHADGDEPIYYNGYDDAPRSHTAHPSYLKHQLTQGKGKEPARKNWSPHDDEFGSNVTDSDYSSEQKPRKLRDEALLFREGGYGTSGGGLPGLFDGRTSPTPSDWSVQTMTYDQAFDLGSPGGLRPPNTPSQKTTFRIGLPTLPSFDTSSNDGGSDATSDSGLDPKLDARVAMKVRRELKRRTRVATIEKKHGKQSQYIPPMLGQYSAASTSHAQHA